jgi:DNA processing protein
MKEASFVSSDAIERCRNGRGFAANVPGLWIAGTIDGLALSCIAIVGTRAPTSYGRRLATRFAEELGRAGCCIISGLALGVDSAAHQGALAAGAPTIGVLGGGHDRFFPPSNRQLADRMIAAGGGVLSPYPPEHPALPHQFLARNAIVAAVADAVVVIEAPARSGALNTAGWAAGRIPVLAVPGDVDRKHVAGCHALIRDGATLARDSNDVLESLGQLPLAASSRAIAACGDPVARSLIAALDSGAQTFDEIVAATGVPATDALAALTFLELDGTIEARGAMRYARVGTALRGEE